MMVSIHAPARGKQKEEKKMKLKNKYQLRKIGRMIKNGRAQIIGRMSDGLQWPEGDKYYIINNLDEMRTDHVLCNLRPGWERLIA
jgi:hypothetical protein